MDKFKINIGAGLKRKESPSEVLTAIWQSLLMQFCQKLSKVDDRLERSHRKWIYLICGIIAALMFGNLIYNGSAHNNALFNLKAQHISIPVPIPPEPYFLPQNNAPNKIDIPKPNKYEPDCE